MIGGVSVFRFAAGTSVDWAGRRLLVAPVETAIRPDFRKQTHRVGAGLALRIGRVEFDDLDVVTKDQQPLFVGGRVEQFADVAPGADERLGVVADAFHRFAAFFNLSETPPDVAFFGFEPPKFLLDARKPTRSETLEDFDQTADAGFRLLLLTTQNVRLLVEFLGFAVQASNGPFNDLFTGFERIADLANPADHRVFECLSRNAGSGARILAAFVTLPRAKIVVVGAVSTGRRIPDQV